MGHCEKKSSYEYMSNCEWLARYSCLNVQIEKQHLDRLQKKYTNCKGVKKITNFGHVTGIQEKPDTTCK
jgi:hypothetical protein